MIRLLFLVLSFFLLMSNVNSVEKKIKKINLKKILTKLQKTTEITYFFRLDKIKFNIVSLVFIKVF